MTIKSQQNVKKIIILYKAEVICEKTYDKNVYY